MKQEALSVRIVKNPFVWGGVGMIIRYGNDRSFVGTLGLAAGILATAGGLGYAYRTHSFDPRVTR
jgi:hypothetical protein